MTIVAYLKGYKFAFIVLNLFRTRNEVTLSQFGFKEKNKVCEVVIVKPKYRLKLPLSTEEFTRVPNERSEICSTSV